MDWNGSGTSSGWEGVLDARLLAPALLHELRQPLTGAEAAVALLERVLGPAVLEREEWALLRQQLSRLAEVMVGYDDLFHAGAGQEVTFVVGPVVARAVDLLAHRVRPMADRFSLVAADGALRGRGSPAALVHATTNVLGNALDAVDGAGSGSRVAVRVLSAGQGPEVRISDEGVGIPEEVRAHLFEPRVTSKPPQRGSGLGLHISRQLLSRFGGELSLVSPGAPGRLGWAVTEFCIRLPAPGEGEP
ncbi:MAG TPA: HAMP domain-containing sensor histidine kinase [Anaeromyxobacter sp.]|nr:HAMP domain-containing sensor histidine kinase [Anaeromyxobacter sp.]